MYGKIISDVLYVVDEQEEGYKPFVYTEAPEAPDGYHAEYIWEEKEDSFEQTWEIIKDYENDLPYEEVLEILLGGSNI